MLNHEGRSVHEERGGNVVLLLRWVQGRPLIRPGFAGPPSPRGEGYGICGVVGEWGLVFHNSG